jgi:hypothetical protein
MNGPNRFNSGQPSVMSTLPEYKTVEIGEVVNITDDEGLDRIKVVINGPTSKGGDNGVALEDLAWCSPMVPKFFTSKPKIGESVFIFTFSSDKKHSDRLYLGPIISQPQNLNFDPRSSTSMNVFSFGTTKPNVAINRVPALKGVFASDDDVAIQGRYNTDLIFKRNEVLLRAGKFMETEPNQNNPYYFSFNNKNPAYIQIKNGAILKKGEKNQSDELGTVTNIVSNKINLLTHKDGAPRFTLANQDNLISDEELLKILEEAHPLPFGDILIQYLKLLKGALLNHVHNGHGKTPTDLTGGGNTQYVSDFVKKSDDLEKQMLSKNIRIN